jgi:hypothetical protein
MQVANFEVAELGKATLSILHTHVHASFEVELELDLKN